MADRISGFGGRPSGATSSPRPSSEGLTGRTAVVGPPARRWEGNVNGFRGRVNLAGPFDPEAPRGTYLDILI
jgi:hypothetical protein